MTRKYNFIYKELVEDENDIVGHIAYSLYKSDKIKFIEDFKGKNSGEEPSEDDLKGFHEFCCLPSNIDRYKMQAISILQQFMSDTLSSTTRQIEEDYVKSQNRHLKEVVAPLVPGFWKSIWQGIVSAFVFALIVAAFAFIKTYNASDVNFSFDKNVPVNAADTFQRK